MRGRWLWALVLTIALGALSAGTAHAQTGVKVLVLKGANDATNQAAVTTIKGLGQANGFTVDEAAGVADINPTKLAGYQSLVFVNVAGDAFDSAGEAALQGFVENGNGFLGIGSTATVEPMPRNPLPPSTKPCSAAAPAESNTSPATLTNTSAW